MNQNEKESIAELIKVINNLSDRVTKLEESLNMGRGAYKLFMTLIALTGIIFGAIKLVGK